MRAVMWDVPRDVLERRRHTGENRRDEVWEGVLHMGPTPSFDHQELQAALVQTLRTIWMPRSGGKVIGEFNVARSASWPRDYRVPDLLFCSRERMSRVREEFIEGGPDVVVEIRSPHDETYEKLAFYAEVGVREVWVIDRDTKAIEVHVAEEGAFRIAASGPDGWCFSAATGLELREKSGQVEVSWPDALDDMRRAPGNA